MEVGVSLVLVETGMDCADVMEQEAGKSEKDQEKSSKIAPGNNMEKGPPAFSNFSDQAV
jgi:hypothetical protein